MGTKMKNTKSFNKEEEEIISVREETVLVYIQIVHG
jgi:hypothetical protein